MAHSFMTRLLQATPAVAAAACAASVVAGGSAAAVPGAPEVALVADIPSHEGHYRATLTPAGAAWDGSNGWTVSLRDTNGEPVEGAALSVEAWRPEGMEVPRRSAATPLAPGEYRVDGVALGAAGWWNVKLAIAAVAADSLAFNVVLR